MSRENFIKIISYEPKLEPAYFIRRSKRFLVECIRNPLLENGETFWVHTNNTGSMLSLVFQGNPVLISKSENSARKLPYSLEAICPRMNLCQTSTYENLLWTGVNTSLPNKFLQALFNYQLVNNLNLLPFAVGYDQIKMEVKHGDSRLDAKISSSSGILQDIWVECKNVSLVEDEMAAFPDAVSERALKHLNTLQSLVREGQRAVMLYVVQRLDAKCFYPADYIDANYAKALEMALQNGVEILIIQLKIQPDGVYFAGNLPLAPCFYLD